ncbi:hypothetical protein BHE74_00019952, partial [Ensete ventricosum]
ITCKEFKDVDAVDNAPVLYSSLLDYHPTWSMKIISIILEQRFIADDSSQDTASVSHQLALTYILYAHCAQEANQDCGVSFLFSMLENTLSEQCISMLWSNRRLNHSLCSSPIDEVFVSNISEQFGLNVKFLDYWINCIKQHPPSQCMLLQKLFPNDFVFSEATGLSSKRPFGAQISTEEIKEVAASLVAEVILLEMTKLLTVVVFMDRRMYFTFY